jgi:Flp pilus assembly protein TadG
MTDSKKTQTAGTGRSAGGVSRSRVLGDERGQSVIELILVAPVFFLLLLGAVEAGRLAYAAIEVTNAARAGVAYGSQSAATAWDSAGMTIAAQDDAKNLTISVPTAKESCSCSGAPGTLFDCAGAAAACSGERVLNYVQVTTSTTVMPIIAYPGLPPSFTLTHTATMRVGQ